MAPPADSATRCERDDGTENCGIEITTEMIEAGEVTIFQELGGADLGAYFSAADLAREVYLAMERRRLNSEFLGNREQN